jgi:uncharacterized LabA/DUF88 family protein
LMAPDGTEAGTPLRVAVLVDWQNTYNGAREAFNLQNRSHVHGNVDAWRLGVLLAGAPDRTGAKRALHEVRVYRGVPDRQRDPRTYAAFWSQVEMWRQRGGDRLVTRFRKLRYPPRHLAKEGIVERPREKGIDVWLAIDLVEMAIRHTVDRVVVMSTDTDLVPALELAVSERGEEFVEVAGWQGPHESAALLNVKDHRIARRSLHDDLYQKIRDTTDYNIPKRERQSTWDDQISAEGRRPRRP